MWRLRASSPGVLREQGFPALIGVTRRVSAVDPEGCGELLCGGSG